MLRGINSDLEILCSIINWAGSLPINRIKLSPARWDFYLPELLQETMAEVLSAFLNKVSLKEEEKKERKEEMEGERERRKARQEIRKGEVEEGGNKRMFK